MGIGTAILGFVLFAVRPTEREYMWYRIAEVFWPISIIASLTRTFLKVPYFPLICRLSHSGLREHCPTTLWLQAATGDRIRRRAAATSNFRRSIRKSRPDRLVG